MSKSKTGNGPAQTTLAYLNERISKEGRIDTKDPWNKFVDGMLLLMRQTYKKYPDVFKE